MGEQTQGPSAPQVSIAEVSEPATEDAADQFCWTVAQVLKRILDPAPSGADDEGMNEEGGR